jgi:homopolymeric O-antigen transport system permease protein
MAISEKRLSELHSTQTNQKRVAQVPTIYIEPSQRWTSLGLSELWTYRELVYFLIWRDVKVRYKQTAIGAAWAILQPFMTMLIFALVFKNFAGVQSDGLPYSVFAYTALLPWTLFSGALARCSMSIVGQSNLISKVYFPRLIVPLAAVVSCVVDFAIAFLLLVVLMIWFGIAPTLGVLTLPAFLILTLATALAVGLWLSALNVRYRDIGHVTPFLVQFWMFASPIGYPLSVVPHKWRHLYSLNPLVGVIEGFRWALLGKAGPDFGVIALSSAAVIALLLGGIVYFKRMERSFADVI